MTLFSDYDTMVRTANLYKTWAKQNPKESAAYDAYAVSVKAGKPIVAPALVTSFGRSLVLAGRMGAALIPVPPPPPPPTQQRVAAAGLIYEFGDKT